MEIVYNTEFVEIGIDREKSLIVDVWKEIKEGKTLSHAEFRDFVDTWHRTVIENKLRLGLTDTRYMNFVIIPELQEYAAIPMSETVASGFARHAMIVSQNDIFMELSIEQTTEEIAKSTGQLISKTFTSEETAKKWLFENH